MYKRHIDVADSRVYITEIDSVVMDLSLIPDTIAFYIEQGDDWWVERKTFNGREKNEDVRHIALKILQEAEASFDLLTAENQEYINNNLDKVVNDL
jgi:hypothetical protein